MKKPDNNKKYIFLCQKGYSSFLNEELINAGFDVFEKADNFVICGRAGGNIDINEFCFPHCCFYGDMTEASGSVNQTAGIISDHFINVNKDKKIENPWSCVFLSAAEDKGLNNRMNNVKSSFKSIFKKRMSRVSKLMKDEPLSYNCMLEGLFVIFLDFERIYVADKAFYYGQKRMKDDSAAPSRSYLKVEEAYYILGMEPAEGETVCDLGAAPGGWSYSAAKRGAKVLAVDNGKLKKGAYDDPLIKHINEDAFKFSPVSRKPYDWLFCDIVEHPNQVLELLAKWIKNGFCRKFIVNLKFGYTNPVKLLNELKDGNSFINAHCSILRIRHLYHDREEFTLTGMI